MGTSPTEPFRFSLNFPLKSKKLINMPKGAGLTKPMKLSAALAEVVGKKEASRAECIKQFFNPDKKMAKVFGSDRIRAFGMAKFLSAHLSKMGFQKKPSLFLRIGPRMTKNI